MAHPLVDDAAFERLPELLKVKEVAKLLRVDRSTVYRWIDEGKLPAIYSAQTGLTRIPRPVLSAFLEKTVDF